MEFYLEPARNIPVLATTEVLVVGGAIGYCCSNECRS